MNSIKEGSKAVVRFFGFDHVVTITRIFPSGVVYYHIDKQRFGSTFIKKITPLVDPNEVLKEMLCV